MIAQIVGIGHDLIYPIPARMTTPIVDEPPQGGVIAVTAASGLTVIAPGHAG